MENFVNFQFHAHAQHTETFMSKIVLCLSEAY